MGDPGDFVDLDAALREEDYRHQPIRLKIADRMWEFPGVMPGIIPLKMARWAAAGITTVLDLPEHELVLFVGDVFGDDVIRELGDAGIGIIDPAGKLDRRMEVLLDELLAQWIGRDLAINGGDGAPGEPVAPSGADPSSPTGLSSPPISDASTASVSPPPYEAPTP